jgi:YD repeat-containing protein
MSESGGMNVNRLTAGGQNVATDVKGNITTLPANLRPAGSTTAMNLTWDSDNKLRSADIDANGTADVNFQYDALGRRVARSGTGGSVVYVQMDQQTIADYPVGGAATTPTFRRYRRNVGLFPSQWSLSCARPAECPRTLDL